MNGWELINRDMVLDGNAFANDVDVACVVGAAHDQELILVLTFAAVGFTADLFLLFRCQRS